MGENWKAIWGSEWHYVVRLGSAISDPHDKREFWENIKARKMADPAFSIYDLFPASKNHKLLAEKYCGEILEMIGTREKPKVIPEELSEFQRDLGELIELGAHMYPLCLWPRRGA